MRGQHKYRAFISYSHADEKWAAWLHKALEAYKVPKHIVGKASDYGPVPERIAPIFRDREELATSTELGDVLTEALKQSACLIVICSPNAAQSRWTNEEILTYKRLGRQDRIFCLIIDGEPNASLFEETAEFECFPEGLMYQMGPDGNLTDIRSEPIAADAREGKDNKQNAKLKLIAGMIGVGFDELKQREQHRRQQRMVAITVAAAIGMAITTGLAATAWFARIEAVQQRVLAEEKAEEARQTTQFMVGLFEVSDPSESLGNSITAREILDKGAARIETELTDQPAIQATLMDTMGTVYTSLGLYEPAVSLVGQSLRKRSALYGMEHAEVARSLNHLGEVQTLKADYEEAEKNLRNALKIRRVLYGDSHLDVAETLTDLADVLDRKGDYEAVDPLILESLSIRRSILGDTHADVAENFEDLGMNFFQQGEYEKAAVELRTAVEMRRALHGKAHPALAQAVGNFATVLSEQGNFDEADVLYREALEMQRSLLGDMHPEIALALNNLASTLERRGDLDAAEETYREALAMMRELLGQSHPDIAVVLTNLAYVLYAKDEVQAAIDHLRQALKMQRATLGDDHPLVGGSASGLGFWLIQEGEYAEAESLLDDALDIRSRALGDLHPQVASTLTVKSNLLLETERFEEARQVAGKARKIMAMSLPEDHWRVAAAATVEGAALTKLGIYQDAEPLLLASVKPLEEAPIPGIGDQNRERLISLYTAWNKPEEANKFRK